MALVDLSLGRLVRSNPALREMLGYSEEELRTMSSADLTHPDDLEAATVPFEGLLAGERDHYRTERSGSYSRAIPDPPGCRRKPISATG